MSAGLFQARDDAVSAWYADLISRKSNADQNREQIMYLERAIDAANAPEGPAELPVIEFVLQTALQDAALSLEERGLSKNIVQDLEIGLLQRSGLIALEGALPLRYLTRMVVASNRTLTFKNGLSLLQAVTAIAAPIASVATLMYDHKYALGSMLLLYGLNSLSNMSLEEHTQLLGHNYERFNEMVYRTPTRKKAQVDSSYITVPTFITNLVQLCAVYTTSVRSIAQFAQATTELKAHQNFDDRVTPTVPLTEKQLVAEFANTRGVNLRFVPRDVRPAINVEKNLQLDKDRAGAQFVYFTVAPIVERAYKSYVTGSLAPFHVPFIQQLPFDEIEENIQRLLQSVSGLVINDTTIQWARVLAAATASAFEFVGLSTKEDSWYAYFVYIGKSLIDQYRTLHASVEGVPGVNETTLEGILNGKKGVLESITSFVSDAWAFTGGSATRTSTFATPSLTPTLPASPLPFPSPSLESMMQPGEIAQSKAYITGLLSMLTNDALDRDFLWNNITDRTLMRLTSLGLAKEVYRWIDEKLPRVFRIIGTSDSNLLMRTFASLLRGGIIIGLSVLSQYALVATLQGFSGLAVDFVSDTPATRAVAFTAVFMSMRFFVAWRTPGNTLYMAVKRTLADTFAVVATSFATGLAARILIKIGVRESITPAVWAIIQFAWSLVTYRGRRAIQEISSSAYTLLVRAYNWRNNPSALPIAGNSSSDLMYIHQQVTDEFLAMRTMDTTRQCATSNKINLFLIDFEDFNPLTMRVGFRTLENIPYIVCTNNATLNHMARHMIMLREEDMMAPVLRDENNGTSPSLSSTRLRRRRPLPNEQCPRDARILANGQPIQRYSIQCDPGIEQSLDPYVECILRVFTIIRVLELAKERKIKYLPELISVSIPSDVEVSPDIEKIATPVPSLQERLSRVRTRLTQSAIANRSVSTSRFNPFKPSLTCLNVTSVATRPANAREAALVIRARDRVALAQKSELPAVDGNAGTTMASLHRPLTEAELQQAGSKGITVPGSIAFAGRIWEFLPNTELNAEPLVLVRQPNNSVHMYAMYTAPKLTMWYDSIRQWQHWKNGIPQRLGITATDNLAMSRELTAWFRADMAQYCVAHWNLIQLENTYVLNGRLVVPPSAVLHRTQILFSETADAMVQPMNMASTRFSYLNDVLPSAADMEFAITDVENTPVIMERTALEKYGRKFVYLDPAMLQKENRVGTPAENCLQEYDDYTGDVQSTKTKLSLGTLWFDMMRVVQVMRSAFASIQSLHDENIMYCDPRQAQRFKDPNGLRTSYLDTKHASTAYTMLTSDDFGVQSFVPITTLVDHMLEQTDNGVSMQEDDRTSKRCRTRVSLLPDPLRGCIDANMVGPPDAPFVHGTMSEEDDGEDGRDSHGQKRRGDACANDAIESRIALFTLQHVVPRPETVATLQNVQTVLDELDDNTAPSHTWLSNLLASRRTTTADTSRDDTWRSFDYFLLGGLLYELAVDSQYRNMVLNDAHRDVLVTSVYLAWQATFHQPELQREHTTPISPLPTGKRPNVEPVVPRDAIQRDPSATALDLMYMLMTRRTSFFKSKTLSQPMRLVENFTLSDLMQEHPFFTHVPETLCAISSNEAAKEFYQKLLVTENLGMPESKRYQTSTNRAWQVLYLRHVLTRRLATSAIGTYADQRTMPRSVLAHHARMSAILSKDSRDIADAIKILDKLRDNMAVGTVAAVAQASNIIAVTQPANVSRYMTEM